MKNFIRLSLLLVFLCMAPREINAQMNIHDSLALVEFYKNTDGPNWINSTNWLTNTPARLWYGVSIIRGRVDGITLPNNGLKGKIVKVLDNLAKLSYLYLQHNELYGPVPLLDKTSIYILDLSYNKFSGAIRTELTRHNYVSQINLSHNDIKSLPDDEYVNNGLYYLNVSYNKLSGEFPKQVYNWWKWSGMIRLDLSHNQLSGQLLNAETHDLRGLDLSYNQLEGNLPLFYDLNNDDFYDLNLSHNNFTGEIPKWPNKFIYVDLGYNKLTGKIPAEVIQSYLEELDLSHNELDGPVPDEIKSISHLEKLYLNNNKFSGKIPAIARITPVSLLTDIDLSHNNFNDSIPSSLGTLSNLETLYLSANKLTGNIPSSFASLVKLKTLHVGNNRLSGSIPSFLTAMPNLENLGFRENNYTFDGLEQLIQHEFDTLNYERQKKVDIHQANNIFSVYAGGTLANNTYKWYKDGVLAATITGDSTFTPTTSGNYNVEVNNSIATKLTLYSDTITFSALTTSQQNNLVATQTNDKSNFFVYPNPAKTNTTIAFNVTGNCVIKIIDVSGRILQTKTITAVKGRNTLRLDVSKYAVGVYFVTLSNEKNETQTLKFNKE